MPELIVGDRGDVGAVQRNPATSPAAACERVVMADESSACAFCDWLAAESLTRVYEDGDVFAEVDPRQPHRGHVLVMPVRHIENASSSTPTPLQR